MDEYQNWYGSACKIAARRVGWMVGSIDEYRKKSENTVSQEFKDALNFTGYDIEPWEAHILAYSGFLVLLFLMLAVDAILFSFARYETDSLTAVAVCTGIVPLAGMVYLSEYPKIHAKFMKIHS